MYVIKIQKYVSSYTNKKWYILLFPDIIHEYVFNFLHLSFYAAVTETEHGLFTNVNSRKFHSQLGLHV